MTLEQARSAMLAEIAYYRAEHHLARTPAGLARLRRGAAGVVLAHLGSPASAPRIEDVEAALLAAVRFAPYPDVVPALAALRADGARLVVVSNWDISLHAVLEQTGLAPLVDAALSSAEAGSAKPEPAIFLRALELVGGRAGDAVMVGDSVDTDIAGALAAGIEAVLVTRTAEPGLASAGAGLPVRAGVRTLADLAGLPELVRYRRRPA